MKLKRLLAISAITTLALFGVANGAVASPNATDSISVVSVSQSHGGALQGHMTPSLNTTADLVIHGTSDASGGSLANAELTVMGSSDARGGSLK